MNGIITHRYTVLGCLACDLTSDEHVEGWFVEVPKPVTPVITWLLIEAITGWLNDWDKEFAYFDNHGAHMPARNVRE